MTTKFRQGGGWQAALIAAVTLFLFTGTCAAGGFDLTGMWYHPDGDSYAVRQDGTDVWWYGKSPDKGKTWSHVFHGKIKGKRIVGKWADVPPAKNRASGTMTLEVIFEGDKLVGIAGEGLNGTVRRTRPK